MGVESAEVVKHGVNAFLATSIVFANELAGISGRVGADTAEVERGLKTEARIGPRSYVRPGAAFAGGTLARDIEYLTQIGEREHVPTTLLRAVRTSNDDHKLWSWRALQSMLGAESGSLDGLAIGVWGLVYKQGTDTLRRSSSVELCRMLSRTGAIVRAHDSAVRTVPDELSGVFTLCATPLGAAEGTSAIVVETNWPSYHDVSPEDLVASMRKPIVVDPNGFLREELGDVAGITYLRVGGVPA
jgi:UDPglucose 6-dehydrogenase